MDTGSVTALILVRHGQATSNVEGRIGGHSDAPLTELGLRQAELTAGAIATEAQPTAIVSSDLPRARQTAELIAKATGLPIRLDARLRERSLGLMDGLTFAEAQERFPDTWQRLRARDPDVCPPGGETVDGVYSRMSEILDEIVRDHAGGRVVVVSHGLAIYHAFAHICGLGSPSRGHQVFALVDNCSISVFTRRSSYWLLGTLNDRSHLIQGGMKEPSGS